MPIDYKEYPVDWKLISKEIIKLQKNTCYFCPAENYKPHWKTGSRVVLTTHHIDGDKNNNSKQNLIALCQRCHLRLDLERHQKRFGINKHYWEEKVKQLQILT